jgi:hypothetical protein
MNALISLLAVSSTRNSAEIVGNFFSGAGDACHDEREEETDFIPSFVSCCREREDFVVVCSVYLYVVECACRFYQSFIVGF